MRETILRFSTIILFACTGIKVSAQKYILHNEKVIFSFTTVNHKKVVLAKDNNDGYLVYRFGTPDKIELEFSKMDRSSWKHFSYSYWLRGGGLQNDGLDLNYVYFTIGNYKYVIYDSYFAVGNKQVIGIYVIDIHSNKRIDIKGIERSKKGSLSDLRDNRLIDHGEEVFN